MIICPNLSNPNVAQEFNELKSALEAADPKHGEAMAYLVWSLNNGNAIDKAPNGAESLLFKSLVDYYEGDRSKAIVAKAKTYSTNFLKWFGNWTGEEEFLDTKNNLFTPTGEVNWDYFELLLDLYHNNQPDSMFSHGRYTLATRPENHFTGEKNTLNHIKFVTQSMLNLLEGKYDMDLPFVSEARASMQNQKDLMIIAAMFHDVAKPYRHGDIHGWESADILRDLLGIDYNNRVAEWAVRHHMPMPFSHKAEFSLSNPEAIEVAKNIARDARRVGIDANTAINAFVLINAADVINGRELDVDDNWAKKAGEEGLKKYNGDISVKNVLSVELKEKVALLKKAFDEIKDEDFGDTAYNYSHQERFDYQAFPEGGREDKKLPYLNNVEYTGVSKVVDENGEPRIVWHGGAKEILIFRANTEENNNTGSGYYEDPITGEKIPFDSKNAIFFSSNKYVASSYAQIYSIRYFKRLYFLTDSLIESFANGHAGISKNYFLSIDELYDFLDRAGEFNPRFIKLKDYIKKLQNDKKRLSEKEVNAAREMFIDLRKLLRLFENDWNISISSWENALNIGRNIIDQYYSEDGAKRLKNGEIPEYIKKEWDLYLKIQNQRQKNGKDRIMNYDSVCIWLSSGTSVLSNDYRLIYDGKELIFDPGNSSKDFPVSEMSIEQILLFFKRAKQENINTLNERLEEGVNKKLNEKSEKYPVFLSIKNPLTHDYEGTHQGQGYKESEKYPFGYVAARQVKKALQQGNDGVVYENVYDPYLADNYGVFSSDQIKHIDNRDGEYTGPNIYHNEGEFDSWNEELQKYYIWLPGAKQRLALASTSNIEQVKSDIRKEFDGFKFKHFTLSILKNKEGRWYIHTGNRNDQKDVKDLRIIAKKIGYTELGVHELSGDQAENLMKYLFSEVHGTSEHMNNIISILKAALKGKNIKIQFVHETVETSPAYYDHETGIITININGAFKNSNGYDNIAAQTVLHELIHAITVETIKHSPELRNELEDLFNKVKQSARIAYEGVHPVYGLKDIYEFIAELSNEDFVKSLQGIHTGSNRKELIPMVIDFMRKVINKILTSINKKWQGTAYADAMELLMKAAFPQDFNIKLLPKPLDELTIFNVISARQLAAQDEANRLITRMNVLYKQYEKIKDKTPSQERLANQIFETLNRLKLHRDISAVQIALELAKLTLGQYDPTTGEPVQISSIYKYLYDAQQNGFSGLSPQSLVDMYRNSIKFYKDLIDNIPSEQAIDLTQEDKNSISDLKSLIDDHIMPIWTQAIMTIGDQIVDDLIDSEVFSSEENKEDMKKVAKDWLHKNLMYGDITAVTSYVYNYSNSSNPIIKQAFHLIQSAELKTLEEVHGIAPKLMKAYLKANSGTRSFTPGWQSMMMEFDDKGIPTGNFVRDINYGLYQKDFKEFLEKLNEDFIRKYRYTYVVDDTGAITNSLTGEFAEDEEWGSNGEMPKYIEYLQEIENFKSDRVHRRYKPQYYMERLSRPYDGTIDPMSPDFKGTKFHHGLSPKTLSRYSYYQSNINYYLNKCQDPITGLVYPERLSKDDLFSLDKWKDRLDKFTSIFNEDGSYKIGEDLKMAYEVRAWLKWLGQHTDTEVMLDDFNRERIQILQESINTGNPKLLDDFLKYNSRAGINPDYIKQSVGSMHSNKIDTDTSFRGKLLRSSLLGMVSNPRIFGRELLKMINNPLFWLLCKASDQAIENANDPTNTSGWTKDQVEAFLKDFYLKDILYVDEYGFYIDENGNKINPSDPSVKGLEDAGKLLTFRQYLINRYTDEALRTGQVSGLIDESTGTPIDFSGLTLTQIRKQISNLLSYKKTYWDEDGNIDRIEDEPLTIFSILAPSRDKFFNKRTNREEPTVILVGDSRFKDSQSFLSDTYYEQYNKGNQVAEIPDINYDNGRYDNSEAYNKVMKDDDVRELYELLVLTMLDMQAIYSTNRKFNYKLPLINARTCALFSRLLKRGYTKKSIQGMWNSMTNIEANDDLLRTKLDYFVGVDGEVGNDVPLKFIRDLKNKEDLSTDLVSSVIMFVDMALNYKNKSEIDSKLKVLRYNMDKDIREVYESKLKPRQEQSAKENSNSTTMFDSMMDVSMYGNKFGNTSEGGPSRTRVALHKTADVFQEVESTAMLGLNMFSMAVGFGDSITRIVSESVAGKYMTVGDCLWALGKCLYYTPACIKNMFNPLANNKMTALMLMNGISKGTFGTYVKADWGKGRKFLTSILMGGWSMLDWMANALLMMSFYHNCRLYEGTEIPKGFYTKYEMQLAFINAGKTKSDGNKAFHNYSHLGNRITLWDAYEFKGGLVSIKPQYEQYVTLRVKTNIATKTKKRGALYNGMNPDNDIPRWKRDVIGRLAGALRAWIQLQVQHLVAGGTDSVARTFTKEQKPEVTTSGTRMKTKYKKEKLTDEQRSRRMAWDYETGTPQDQIFVGLARSLKTIFKEANQMLLHKPRTAKLSEVEKYAWKDTLIFIGMLSMMMIGWTFIHDDAREVPKPTTREEAGPASMLNPVDYYEYIRDIYIPNQYWKLATDDIYFRIVEAKISSVNVQQVLDIVNALTALKSGFDNQFAIILNDDDDSEGILKQGGYKFYTKGEKALYKAVGPVNNLHTFLTYYGATGNLRWYTNRFGKVYRAFGYDFKAKDKAADKEKSAASEGFSGGDFSGGGFEGGGFSGGEFF